MFLGAFADLKGLVKKVREVKGETHVPYTVELAREQIAAELAKVGPCTTPKLVVLLADKRAGSASGFAMSADLIYVDADVAPPR